MRWSCKLPAQTALSSPIEIVTVACPQCGERYETQYRTSMNRTLDPSFDEAYIEGMSTGFCPICGQKVMLGAIVAEIRRVEPYLLAGRPTAETATASPLTL